MRVIEEVHPTFAHFQAVVHWRMEGPTPHLTHYNILNTSTSDINAMRCTIHIEVFCHISHQRDDDWWCLASSLAK